MASVRLVVVFGLTVVDVILDGSNSLTWVVTGNSFSADCCGISLVAGVSLVLLLVVRGVESDLLICINLAVSSRLVKAFTAAFLTDGVGATDC